MKLSSNWIRDFVDLTVDDRKLAEDLTSVGIAVEGISGLGANTVFEMEIGTNRPDAMNHYGVAREAAAIYDRQFSVLSSRLSAKPSSGESFPITVEEPELCPRFSARVIRATRVKPSPEKIAHRLQLLDQRPISNAVDATNYVLWEMGKPTHVFDLDLLQGGRLIIRKAKQGEKLKTLDGVERTLTAEDLVVADGRKPVGLAGVMGGYDTMITEKTKNILIESAWWDPLTVRKMSRRHGLHTDASHGFERGADFESTVLSCDLVARLILDSGGGELAGDVVDVISRKLDQAPIVLRLSEVRRILGDELTGGHVFHILKKLGFILIPEGQEDAEFRVQVPSWRLDVEREIDLIEEIARLHGYDKFENTLPVYRGAVAEPPHAALDADFRERARALGYNEALSLTFISHPDAEKFSSATVLELENPLSEEASVMRTSMAPGMLDMLAYNLNRGTENVRLFEMGRVYETRIGERVEPERACLGATVAAVNSVLPASGALDRSKGEQAQAAESFRAFKGDVEAILSAFAHRELTFDRATAEYFHSGRSARALLDGIPVAQFGQVAESAKAERKLRQDVFLAEFDLDLLHARGARSIDVAAPPKYPAVERDFSFVFPHAVEFDAMKRAVSGLEVAELRSFAPVEIFRGQSIGAGKYSVLLRARFQSEEGTLRDEQIAEWSAQIVKALQALGGTQRA
ncbi:MAG TPA: phenylalanine--tRNA ligase subunit beta [Candidatus Binatia bacterium]|nr:phenylalanine--tRNA ligase subunit beta [Candidatus Binatia bacterium]